MGHHTKRVLHPFPVPSGPAEKAPPKAELTPEAIFDIMSEMKANQRERVRIEVSAIRKYFPRSCTARQMEESIVKMLEAQYRKKQRSQER